MEAKAGDRVESVKTDAAASNKLTATEKVDPVQIKLRTEEKKAEEKKPPKESAVVLKIRLHCEGCISITRKIILKIDGVKSVEVDEANDLVTVKGTMEPTELAPYLRDKLKRSVEVVPSKEDEKKDRKAAGADGGDKKEKVKDAGGGGEKTKKKVDFFTPQPKEEDGGDEKKGDGKEKEKAGDKKPKEKMTEEETPPIESAVVLKIRLHCEECISKTRKIILKIDGVKSVEVDEANDLVTVNGTMEPTELAPYLRDKLKRSVEVVPSKKDEKKESKAAGADGGDKKEMAKDVGGGGEKTKKKVYFVTPQPQEDGGGDEKKKGDGKEEEKAGDKKTEEKKPPKESMVVSKIRLFCEGCISEIEEIILKIDGVKSVEVDEAKYLVTVKGTIEATQLLEPYLRDKLKGTVEVVPPKKDAGGDKKEKAKDIGGGGDEKKEGGGDKKKEGGEGSGASRHPYVGWYPPNSGYMGNGYLEMFSDENPNACLVM